MIREIEWLAGITVLAVAAILLIVQGIYLEPGPARVTILALGLATATIGIVFANVYGYFLKSRSAPARIRGFGWLFRPSWYRGVNALWISAGVLTVGLAFSLGSGINTILIAAFAVAAALAAMLWGDLVEPAATS